jgi:thymidylate synthase ThyX
MVATARFPRRVYPLDARTLTEEQIAVAFAMTSRRPEAFDEIARQVSAEKAAEFHERWVLGYGHASVAEHAVIHMAVENISRLACDALEDNRLASYTEKSSRYQVLERGAYYTPPELDRHPKLRQLYTQTCDGLFDAYHALLEKTQAYLRTARPRGANERDGAYNLRIRREATDACRFVLPAATLTNVGMTLNARSLEHAIRKLAASQLQEERDIGKLLKDEGQKITPTLIKYAEPTEYLKSLARQRGQVVFPVGAQHAAPLRGTGVSTGTARLVGYDRDAERKVVAALLFAASHRSYAESWDAAGAMGTEERAAVLARAWESLGPFDTPGREAELPQYTFELVMDYGAYREFKRHRMQTYIAQPLTVAHGAVVPDVIRDTRAEASFLEATGAAEKAYAELSSGVSPLVAQYVVTHAHRRRVLAQINLRECYHLFRLRTGPQAHPTLRQVMGQALDECERVHPALFRHFKRREK